VDGSILRTVVNFAGRAIDCNIKGCLVDANMENLFAFSQVSLTDDETIASPDQNLSDLGSIELCVYRVELTKSAVQSVTKPMGVIESAIHERSKKMSMHRVTLQGYGGIQNSLYLLQLETVGECAACSFYFQVQTKRISSCSRNGARGQY